LVWLSHIIVRVLDRRQLGWALVEEGVHNVTLPVGDSNDTRLLEDVSLLFKLDLVLVLKDWIDEAVN